MTDRILILDFGSQVTQLIARRVRESGVYCEIMPFNTDPARIREFGARAVILEGDDYDALWERHKNLWPRWAVYDKQVERKIPLVEIRLGSERAPTPRPASRRFP